MPIANCTVTPECFEKLNRHGNLIELWQEEAETSSDEMTINITCCDEQLGKHYAVMANLWVPSVWSFPNKSALQTGLALALSRHFEVDISAIHVVTTIVTSGMVVESGKEIKW